VFSRQTIEHFDAEKFNFPKVLLETIEERQEFIDQYPIASSLTDVKRQHVQDAYVDKIYGEIEKRFPRQNPF
jgi:hypothetical protein